MANKYTMIYYQNMDEIQEFCLNLHQKQNQFFRDIQQKADELGVAIRRFAKTGKYDSKFFGELKTEVKNGDGEQEEKTVVKKGRKGKKPTLSELNEAEEPNIKKEKVSNGYSTASSTVTSTSISSIKENVPLKTEEEMPAPSWLPPKRKIKTERPSRSVRTTRTKGRKAAEDTSEERNSDVILQSANVSTVSLSDTEDSDGSEKSSKAETASRSTRTKTRQKEKEDSARKNKEENALSDVDETATRSTRTKTLRKVKNDTADIEHTEEVQTRSTRTKTNKKAEKESKQDSEQDEVIEPNTARSTRTKTMKKNNKEQKELGNEAQSDAESVKSSKSRKADHSQEPSSKNSEQTSSEDPRKTKRIRAGSTDEEAQTADRKKSKSDSPVPEKDAHNTTGLTEYEDARSTIGLRTTTGNNAQQQLNSTFVKDKQVNQPGILNVTQVVEPVFPNSAYNAILDNAPALSEDESLEVKTPPKKQNKSKATKEVFSPYEKTTMKKKVEAFEKLQQAGTATNGTLMTKTKNTPSIVKKMQSKYVTPTESKLFHPTSSSTSKISRLISSHTLAPNESLSHLRNTQKESREKQRKQLEREQAIAKKEAMLQSQAEAKRKLNEEKQMKALQQRKAIEAEKMKQLEEHRQKEERLKQREQEREEHLQQQRIELEKKRQAQKMKLQEIQKQKQQQFENQLKEPPIYMTTKPPRLPTEDCYDSDDEEYNKNIQGPSWATGDRLRIQQFVMLTAGERIKNSLFHRHAQTPNLKEIFEVIDPRKLKRNSSMLWRAPPRYTMMPDLDETRFSDIDDIDIDDD